MSDWPAAYLEHAPGIRAFLRRRLRQTETAEDLCQETFVRAMGAEDNLRDRSKLRSYLYRTAHNLLVNHRRRPPVVRIEADLGDEVQLEDAPESRTEGPMEDAAFAQLQQHLLEALQTLPPEHRLAFELGVLQRRPYAEIAEQTGWTVAKVKINVLRARRRLMEGLREHRELD